MSDLNDGNAAAKFTSMVVDQANAEKLSMSPAEANRLAIVSLLGALGGLNVTDDDIEFTGTKIVLPEQYAGKVPEAIKYLKTYYLAQEKPHGFNRTFRYRPFDGANAFQNTMRKMFGNVGIGKNSPATFFSPEKPPQMVTIPLAAGKTIQVPWGEVDFPPLEASFELGVERSPEFGDLFALNATAPLKYKRHIEAFFDLLEQELREHSMYKGQAINGAAQPDFLDLSRLDRNRVVYSEDVLTQLDTNLWSLLRHTDLMREMKMPLKRSVLVEGPYGTGKTLAGMLTAQEAVKHGWTYILCRPGKDNLFNVLQTAQLYAPAVVWYEDIDTLAKGGTDEDISKLLDALDGVQGKGAEVLAGFTTNFVDKLQKGTLRPGRIDAIIQIAGLDRAGFEKMVKLSIPSDIRGNIDYDQVEHAFAGYLPAFVQEAINNAMRYAITRTNGRPTTIETDDLVNAGEGLRRQYNLMNDADEGANAPTLDSVFTTKLDSRLNKVRTAQYDTESEAGLRVVEDRTFTD